MHAAALQAETLWPQAEVQLKPMLLVLFNFYIGDFSPHIVPEKKRFTDFRTSNNLTKASLRLSISYISNIN